MPSKAQWDKMKKFFLLPTKHPGIPGTEEKLFKAYEEAKTNHEKLEIVFHLPIIEVICALLLNLCIIYSKIGFFKYAFWLIIIMTFIGTVSTSRMGCGIKTWW